MAMNWYVKNRHGLYATRLTPWFRKDDRKIEWCPEPTERSAFDRGRLDGLFALIETLDHPDHDVLTMERC